MPTRQDIERRSTRYISTATPYQIKALKKRLGIDWVSFYERFVTDEASVRCWLRGGKIAGETAERVDGAIARYRIPPNPPGQSATA